MAMTGRERVYAALGHEKPDGVPYDMRMQPEVAAGVDALYGTNRWRGFVDNDVQRVRTAADSQWRHENPGGFKCDLYGSVWKTDVGDAMHMIEPVLADGRFDRYEFPDVSELVCHNAKASVSKARQEPGDRFLVSGINFGVLDRTLNLRGFEAAYMDLAGNDSGIECLLDRVTDHLLEHVTRIASLDLDGVVVGDDWGDQNGVLIGAERWRRLIKPRAARLVERIRLCGKTPMAHCDGNITEIMPDVIEIGLEAIESVQPEAMNPYELKRLYGDRITFWGGLGSQSLVPFGTPDAIRIEVRRLASEMGTGGGYILAPSKTFMPDTPAANAAAAMEAFIEAKCGRLPADWPGKGDQLAG